MPGLRCWVMVDILLEIILLKQKKNVTQFRNWQRLAAGKHSILAFMWTQTDIIILPKHLTVQAHPPWNQHTLTTLFTQQDNMCWRTPGLKMPKTQVWLSYMGCDDDVLICGVLFAWGVLLCIKQRLGGINWSMDLTNMNTRTPEFSPKSLYCSHDQCYSLFCQWV